MHRVVLEPAQRELASQLVDALLRDAFAARASHRDAGFLALLQEQPHAHLEHRLVVLAVPAPRQRLRGALAAFVHAQALVEEVAARAPTSEVVGQAARRGVLKVSAVLVEEELSALVVGAGANVQLDERARLGLGAFFGAPGLLKILLVDDLGPAPWRLLRDLDPAPRCGQALSAREGLWGVGGPGRKKSKQSRRARNSATRGGEEGAYRCCCVSSDFSPLRECTKCPRCRVLSGWDCRFILQAVGDGMISAALVHSARALSLFHAQPVWSARKHHCRGDKTNAAVLNACFGRHARKPERPAATVCTLVETRTRNKDAALRA